MLNTGLFTDIFCSDVIEENVGYPGHTNCFVLIGQPDLFGGAYLDRPAAAVIKSH